MMVPVRQAASTGSENLIFVRTLVEAASQDCKIKVEVNDVHTQICT